MRLDVGTARLRANCVDDGRRYCEIVALKQVIGIGLSDDLGVDRFPPVENPGGEPILTAAVQAWNRRPLRPNDDHFFVPPAGLAAHPPGRLISSRRVDVGFLGVIAQPKLKAWQLAYRSTDLHGRPELAVTTVILPWRSGGTPPGLVAYQCAIDAISNRCFPSYSLRLGTFVPGALPPVELILITSILERGFAISIADHEGRSGSFGAPREPGYRVLDGLRASLAFEELELAPSTPVAIYGYSGGGMASAWAAEMAPSYAPELHLVGAALGSPVGDPGEAFIKLNSTFFAGLPAMVVAGLIEIYPDLGRLIRDQSNQEGQDRLARIRHATTTSAILRHRRDDFDDYLALPLADLLARTEVLEVFDELRLGKNTPTCPLLVVQSTRDKIINVRDVDGLVDRYTDGGATVHYVRDRLSDHISLLPIAHPLMMSWLEARFAAVPAPAGTSTARSLMLSATAMRGYAAMVGTVVRMVGRGGGVVRRRYR